MSHPNTSPEPWPDIPYAPWAETAVALHLWTQIMGKYRLAHTPWLNHSWHATLYVTPRGLTTGLVPDQSGMVSLALDFHDGLCVVETDAGARETFPLGAMGVSQFQAGLRDAVRAVGGTFSIHGRPNEMKDAVPFTEDTMPRPYDGAAVLQFHQALVRIERVFSQFRTGFLAKVSPVHLFWGSFDLAVTRFSGADAPPHPGGVPNLPDTVTQEAYSHEVSSAGFWPGAGIGEPMFYSYAYPTPETFSQQPVAPDATRWDAELGEFLLPYGAVRASPNPDKTLLDFLTSTYVAAAKSGDWDRKTLECDMGVPGVPRAV
ncbi:DUF5996 family protein [Litoreibacter roseus]|uniref:Ava_C0101 and related proteins n=1 Tax=Litoreibacter roseus TaxID=2601869 RepID=A0A6N6JM56_9RHOB|nr:DUF5996 family protein [Litoreibacter roseus]GFE66358.1 hypothetical protein KIN_34320 [Litoreibacter roseus]